ncbi:hypothetical protein SLEP1_g59446 [Rubroshorea leprosula]|uniref:Uncharacterized protein n=1 Tax=Rubroshorea leprosula TaxID=152421 RepID=A0AAV5MVY9_9ROSI|nr:hypothetical protein SLEP1_g59446 [Rubroshorea leprosula]
MALVVAAVDGSSSNSRADGFGCSTVAAADGSGGGNSIWVRQQQEMALVAAVATEEMDLTAATAKETEGEMEVRDV